MEVQGRYRRARAGTLSLHAEHFGLLIRSRERTAGLMYPSIAYRRFVPDASASRSTGLYAR
jgi:hypothetical protein